MANEEPWTAAKDADRPDQDVVDLAHRMFDLARDGDGALAAYVDEGVPVDLTDSDGNTLLMLAAYHGHAELVQALVERGADPGRLNDRGQSPLAGAVFNGSAPVVRVLVEAGADPTAGDPSAVQAAYAFGQEELVDLLDRRLPDEGEPGTDA